MSIDAVVEYVSHNEDGSGKLMLIDRPARSGENDGIAGQRSLHYDAAPHDVTALNWRPIWGSADQIYYKDRLIAKRMGYTKIVFCVDSIVNPQE